MDYTDPLMVIPDRRFMIPLSLSEQNLSTFKHAVVHMARLVKRSSLKKKTLTLAVFFIFFFLFYSLLSFSSVSVWRQTSSQHRSPCVLLDEVLNEEGH